MKHDKAFKYLGYCLILIMLVIEAMCIDGIFDHELPVINRFSLFALLPCCGLLQLTFYELSKPTI